MNILGLSFGFHDAAAVLIINGEIVAAISEERISRKKHDSRLPVEAIKAVLNIASLTISDIDRIMYHENSYLKAERIILSSIKKGFPGMRYLTNAAKTWLKEGKFFPEKKIASELGVDLKIINHCQHHQSHAASVFLCSPFEKATVITIDGIGESETLTISIANGHHIKKISSSHFPHSLGLVYSAFTSYLGFSVNGGEYKVMGMSGFGSPTIKDKIKNIFHVSKKGCLTVDTKHFNFSTPERVSYNPSIIDWLGEPRIPESDFNIDDTSDKNRKCQHYANIAASLQKASEEIIVDIVRTAIKLTGEKNVCLSGGVALNSLANAKIERDLDVNLFIQPASGDDGCALGAALFEAHVNNHEPGKMPGNFYLGRHFSDNDIQQAFIAAGIDNYITLESDEVLINEVADRISQGKVIGWFQGRDEWGPRALGNRSILANPTIKSMQRRVNEKVKYREPFRPFAPSILVEKISDYFDINKIIKSWSPENFMLAVHKAKPETIDKVPAVVHVDGTSRVQAVHKESNLLYYQLIEEVYKRIGVPILLNTSFNLRGEPIVGSPKDAIETFAFSGIDTLAIGRFIVDKESL